MAGTRVIGLDIGATAVRAAELEIGPGGPTGKTPPMLHRVGQIALPPGVVRDGEVTDAEVVAEALKRLWATEKFSTKDVVIGVGNQRVVVRELAVPWMPAAQIKASLPYQVQEMLRAERIFEAAGIQEELDAYNPLIPDGSNWKATFMVEYEDADERREALSRLIGIEDRVWVRVAGFDKVGAIADEDLEREDETKTSSVHFLRFELSPEMVAAVKGGAAVEVGTDHPEYAQQVSLTGPVRDSLAGDLA